MEGEGTRVGGRGGKLATRCGAVAMALAMLLLGGIAFLGGDTRAPAASAAVGTGERGEARPERAATAEPRRLVAAEPEVPSVGEAGALEGRCSLSTSAQREDPFIGTCTVSDVAGNRVTDLRGTSDNEC